MSENNAPNANELEQAILRTLLNGGISYNLGRGYGGNNVSKGVVECILEKYPLSMTWPKTRVAEAIWVLISRGLVFIDFTFHQGQERHGRESYLCEDWKIQLTERGRAAACDTTVNPDVPEGYLEHFVRSIPQASDTVQMYVKEALETYTQRCYLACAVMLGVAAEAAFLDLLSSFCGWLPRKEGANLRRSIDKRGTPYSKLHENFRRRLETHKKDLSSDLEADLDLRINAVLGLIRDYRNDSGHPTGKPMDRATCHVALVQFAYAMQRLFALKVFFDSQKQLNP